MILFQQSNPQSYQLELDMNRSDSGQEFSVEKKRPTLKAPQEGQQRKPRSRFLLRRDRGNECEATTMQPLDALRRSETNIRDFQSSGNGPRPKSWPGRGQGDFAREHGMHGNEKS